MLTYINGIVYMMVPKGIPTVKTLNLLEVMFLFHEIWVCHVLN